MNISPAIAKWLNENFKVKAESFYKLGYQSESDIAVFMYAKQANVIFFTKDKDFAELLSVHKTPPRILFLRTGNISNDKLKQLLLASFEKAIDLLTNSNFDIVELY